MNLIPRSSAAPLTLLLLSANASGRPGSESPGPNVPHMIHRAAQRYVGVQRTATMDQMPKVIPAAIGQVFGWLGKNGIRAAGPPIVRFLVIDMRSKLRIEVGVPVAAPVAGDSQVRPGVLPAGDYVTLAWIDRNPVAGNAALQAWAKQRHISFAMKDTPAGSVWKCRYEDYPLSPDEERKAGHSETEINYLTAPSKPGARTAQKDVQP